MGRPVDIEIVPRAHAILSASSAERWLTCTPSARLEEHLSDEDSDFARDGTAAHAFAETRLRYKLGETSKEEYTAAYLATKTLYADIVKTWEASDWESIDSYVSYVLSEVERLEADEVIIEARVDYSRYAEGGFGTSDALLISRKQRKIKSIDLKFGKGVAIYAEENPQAMLYALGGIIKADPEASGLFDSVEWAIHQPRLDYVGEDGCTADELLDWAETVVRPAAEKAWAGKGQLVPTTHGCRFCKASATCRARIAQNVLIARRDFMEHMDEDGNFDPEEFVMSMDELAKILPELDQWMQWARAAQEFALKQARDNGVEVPGYKLVRGRANRRWGVVGEKLAEELAALGVSESDMYVAPEPALRSVAQLEKVVGKKRFADTIAPILVSTPPGTPALVPASDPRPAINAAAEAAAEFSATE